MKDSNHGRFDINGPVIGSNIGTSGKARAGDVHIGHIRDVSEVLRLLDELRAELREAGAPAMDLAAVDDLRIEARKHKPSKDVTHFLMGKLRESDGGRELGEQMKELAKAFDALF